MRRAATTIALAFLLALPARADRLVLRDGRTLEGVLQYVGDKQVEMESTGGNLRLSRDRIQRIEMAAPGENALIRARFALHRNRIAQAADMVQRALDEGASRDTARALCVEESRLLQLALCDRTPQSDAWHDIITDLASDFPLRTTATLATRHVPTSTSAAAWLGAEILERPPEAHAPPPPDDTVSTQTLTAQRRYLLAMARILDEARRRVSAGEMIERLDPDGFAHAVLHEGFVQSLIVERVKHYLNQLDFPFAAALIDRAERGGAVVGPATRTLFLFRWASFERRRGHYDRALTILDERLRSQSPALAVDTMRSILTQARMRLTETRDYERAVFLMAKWAEKLMGRADARDVLANLHREWGENLLERDKPAEARDAFRRFAVLKPAENPATLFARCDFRERLLALLPDDAAGAFELAQWAEKEGLISGAIEAYERAARNPDLRPLAVEQKDLLRDRVVLKHLETCTDWFEKGNPHRALEEIEKFEFLPVTRRLRPEIDKLRRACHREIARRESLRPVHAETLFQDAQRQYYAGKKDLAEEALRQVLQFFSDTPAAERARRFLRQVETRNRINRLEGISPRDTTPADMADPTSALDREVTQLLEELEIYQPRATPTQKPVEEANP